MCLNSEYLVNSDVVDDLVSELLLDSGDLSDLDRDDLLHAGLKTLKYRYVRINKKDGKTQEGGFK